MAYVETPADADREEEAVSPIAIALALGVAHVFHRIQVEYVGHYISTGNVLDAAKYEAELGSAIRVAYTTVRGVIGGGINTYMLNNPTDPLSVAVSQIDPDATLTENIRRIRVATNEALDEVLGTRLATVLPNITDTTNGKLEAYIESIIEEFPEAPRRVVGTLAGRRFEDSIPERATLIGKQETSAAAEAVKFTEVETLGGSLAPLEAQGLVVRLFNKEWVTRGDDKVRLHHMEADGQIQPSDIPYVVGGELLQYPRDFSLGASKQNTVNCRCASIRNLDVALE